MFMRGTIILLRENILLKVEQNYLSSGWPAEDTVMPFHHFLWSCHAYKVFPLYNSLNTQNLMSSEQSWGAEQVWKWNWKFLRFESIHPRKKKTQKINSFKELQWQNLKVLKIKMYIDLINLTTFCSIKQEWQNSQMSTKWDSVQLKYKFNDPKPIKIYSTFSLNIGT